MIRVTCTLYCMCAVRVVSWYIRVLQAMQFFRATRVTNILYCKFTAKFLLCHSSHVYDKNPYRLHSMFALSLIMHHARHKYTTFYSLHRFSCTSRVMHAIRASMYISSHKCTMLLVPCICLQLAGVFARDRPRRPYQFISFVLVASHVFRRKWFDTANCRMSQHSRGL